MVVLVYRSLDIFVSLDFSGIAPLSDRNVMSTVVFPWLFTVTVQTRTAEDLSRL